MVWFFGLLVMIQMVLWMYFKKEEIVLGRIRNICIWLDDTINHHINPEGIDGYRDI